MGRYARARDGLAARLAALWRSEGFLVAASARIFAASRMASFVDTPAAPGVEDEDEEGAFFSIFTLE